MSAPAYAGEVRLGVPHDIVGPYLPPILPPLRQGVAARARVAQVHDHAEPDGAAAAGQASI